MFWSFDYLWLLYSFLGLIVGIILCFALESSGISSRRSFTSSREKSVTLLVVVVVVISSSGGSSSSTSSSNCSSKVGLGNLIRILNADKLLVVAIITHTSRLLIPGSSRRSSSRRGCRRRSN